MSTTTFTYIGVAPYGGSMRSVSLSLHCGDDVMTHQHLTPEECEELARLLMNAAHVARQEEVTPDSTSIAPQEVARVRVREEEMAV